MPFDGIGFAVSDTQVNKIEDIIDLLATPDKWCKGVPKTPDGRFCIRGALIAVNAVNLRPVILQAIHEVTGRSYRRIEAFNDDVDTTHRLMLRVLAHARDDLIGQQAAIHSLPRALKWRVRLQEWIKSFAAETPV
jgi:hypothetical protein